jgi:hypothetical protein
MTRQLARHLADFAERSRIWDLDDQIRAGEDVYETAPLAEAVAAGRGIDWVEMIDRDGCYVASVTEEDAELLIEDGADAEFRAAWWMEPAALTTLPPRPDRPYALEQTAMAAVRRDDAAQTAGARLTLAAILERRDEAAPSAPAPQLDSIELTTITAPQIRTLTAPATAPPRPLPIRRFTGVAA